MLLAQISPSPFPRKGADLVAAPAKAERFPPAPAEQLFLLAAAARRDLAASTLGSGLI